MKVNTSHSFQIFAFLTWILLHPTLSSEAPWWDGIDFEDAPKLKDSHESNPNIIENVQQQQQQNGGPVIQIPCGFIFSNDHDNNHELIRNSNNVFPLQTKIDTGLTTSQIDWSYVKSNKKLANLVRKDSTLGPILPSSVVWLRMGSTEATVPAPTLLVVQDENDKDSGEHDDNASSFPLRLGLDFLRSNEARIDLRKDYEEILLLIDGESVMIPMLRPRPSFSLSEEF